MPSQATARLYGTLLSTRMSAQGLCARVRLERWVPLAGSKPAAPAPTLGWPLEILLPQATNANLMPGLRIRLLAHQKRYGQYCGELLAPQAK